MSTLDAFQTQIEHRMRSEKYQNEKFSTAWISSVDVTGSIPIPPPPGRVIRAYQTYGPPPVAVAHAFVIIRPTARVGASADTICGVILTSRRILHCFCR
jgi:hypothetical protein